MELEDDAGRDGDVIVALVDDVQDVPVPGDLTLVAVFRLHVLEHKLAQAPVGGRDVFDLVRSARALDLGHLHQGGEAVGMGGGEQGRPALELPDVPESGYDLRSHQAGKRPVEIELSHDILAIFVILSTSILDVTKISLSGHTGRRPLIGVPRYRELCLTLFNLLKLAIPGGRLLPEASCGLGAVRNSFIWHGWYRISLCARIPARVRKGTGAASSVPSYFSPMK